MTLLQFEIFQAVVETGSFTKAGEILGLTQSAVSHAICRIGIGIWTISLK